MSDTGYYSLPTGKLHQKPETSRLKIFPVGYIGSFYRNLADNIDTFLGPYFYGRITKEGYVPLKMFKSIFWRHLILQREWKHINHYVTGDRINNTRFRQKLDPVSKKYSQQGKPP